MFILNEKSDLINADNISCITCETVAPNLFDIVAYPINVGMDGVKKWILVECFTDVTETYDFIREIARKINENNIQVLNIDKMLDEQYESGTIEDGRHKMLT